MARRRNTMFYGRDTFSPIDIDSDSIPTCEHSNSGRHTGFFRPSTSKTEILPSR